MESIAESAEHLFLKCPVEENGLSPLGHCPRSCHDLLYGHAASIQGTRGLSRGLSNLCWSLGHSTRVAMRLHIEQIHGGIQTQMQTGGNPRALQKHVNSREQLVVAFNRLQPPLYMPKPTMQQFALPDPRASHKGASTNNQSRASAELNSRGHWFPWYQTISGRIPVRIHTSSPGRFSTRKWNPKTIQKFKKQWQLFEQTKSKTKQEQIKKKKKIRSISEQLLIQWKQI